MPVRSLGTAVLAWPDAEVVRKAADDWVRALMRVERGVLAVGVFGSYARGDWGVGSDLDLVVVVADSPDPFERRAARLDSTGLPVPVDVLVYTLAEWQQLVARPRELVWLSEGGPPANR